MNRFDPDQDYDDFERWFQDLDSAKWEALSFAWMESLPKGAVLPRNGHDSFKGWVFDQRWPEVRMAREMERLTTMADYARWAA